MAIGDFDSLCAQSPLPLCALVGADSPLTGGTGINTPCYARSVEVANTIIFEAANDFMHIIALIMTVIMIIHIRSKFTAVGRKEISLFFYLYIALTIFSLLVDAGVVYPSMGVYPYFVAAQNGLASALCTCLLINGFVGFQLYEDGTTQSLLLLRGLSFLMFLISGMVSILTFEDKGGLGPTNTLGLFVVLYIVNAICVCVYVVMQALLVANTLQDRWPMGHIAFGTFFFIAGQVIVYVFGDKICAGAQHYLDGLFFATMCNLLAVMMVYKYWDSITREDLEFSVGTKQGQWEVKELLAEDDDMTQATPYHDDPSDVPPRVPAHRQSTLGAQRGSAYAGGY